jgi:hypothetical protein
MRSDMLFAFIMGLVGALPLLVFVTEAPVADMIILLPLAVLWAHAHKWRIWLEDKSEGSKKGMKYTTMFLALVVFFLGACGGDTTGINLPEGVKGGPCYRNNTCDEGLVCDKDLVTCVSEQNVLRNTSDGGVLLDDGGVPIGDGGVQSFETATPFREVTASLDKISVTEKGNTDPLINGYSCVPDRGCSHLQDWVDDGISCETSDNDYTCEIQCVKVDTCAGSSQYGTCCVPVTSYERNVSFDIFKDTDSKIGSSELLSVTPKFITVKVHENAWDVEEIEVLVGDRVLVRTGPIAFGQLPLLQLSEWDTNKARDVLTDALLDYETPFSLTMRVHSTFEPGDPKQPMGKLRASISVAYSATF